MKPPERFVLELELLSPLHIGDGNTLIPMEYILEPERNALKVVNLDFLVDKLRELSPRSLEQLGEEMLYCPEMLKKIAKPEVAKVILSKSELILRDISVTSEAAKNLERDLKYKDRDGKPMINKAQIKTFVKTGEKPFIPGSSVKGAFRTALAYDILKNQKAGKSSKDILDLRNEQDAVEKYLLRAGDGIDKDVMALMGFSDSSPVDSSSLAVVRSTRIGVRDIRNYYEALPKGVKATLMVFFKDYKEDKGKPGWDKAGRQVDLLPRTPEEFLNVLNRFAGDFIAFEKKRVSKMRERDQSSPRSPGSYSQEFDRIIRFYQALKAKMDQNPDAGFMTLGWGTGWAGKTVGMLFNEYPEAFREMMRAYKMGKPPKGNWKPDPQSFPKTREVILGKDIEPIFGWVMLRSV